MELPRKVLASDAAICATYKDQEEDGVGAVGLWGLIQLILDSSVSPVEGFNDTKSSIAKFQTGVAANFMNMEQYTGLLLPPYPSEIYSEVIETTFSIGTEHLKITACSFLWDKQDIIVESWSVASWSSYTQRSYILNHGNTNNITTLSEVTRYNTKHKPNCK